ncbi:MAG: hypothetical protein ACLSC9_01930 [Barnesiella sp.]
MNLKLFGITCAVLVLFGGCVSKSTTKPDGWYHISEDANDSFGVKPFVTVKDFEYIGMDSVVIDGKTRYQIIGKLKDEKNGIFADETGKAAGKRIGFLFRGELLCSPSPNCRIESGHFAITPFYMDEGEKMWSLLNSLREEM